MHTSPPPEDHIPYGKAIWSSFTISFTPFKWRHETYLPHIMTMRRYRFGPLGVQWFCYPTREEMEIKASGL